MNYLITGAATGLGRAIVDALAKVKSIDDNVYLFDKKLGHDVRDPDGTFGDPPDDVDVLINCAGVNGGAWFGDIEEADYDNIMDTNAKGILMVSQWLFPVLKARRGTILNIVSNASHMPMTTSLAYNASKAAAHIMTLQMAREMTKLYEMTVFGISPNKLKGTAMSRDIEEQVCALRGWTHEYAEEYQRKALVTGEETDPEQLAEFIAFLLSTKARHRFLSGCVIPYGA